MNATRIVRQMIAGALLSSGVALTGVGPAVGISHANNDQCLPPGPPGRPYDGPGNCWCPGNYVWPGLRATGWDLNVCHVYHEQCPPGHVGGCPDNIAEGPPPPPPPVIFHTQEECMRVLGLLCLYAPN